MWRPNQIVNKYFDIYQMHCWLQITRQDLREGGTLLHQWQDLLYDLKGHWAWDHGLQFAICFVSLLIHPFSKAIQGWLHLEDWFDQKHGGVPAGLNICNQLSVLTLLSCIGVIPEIDTLSPHPLLIMGCLVNSGAKWPALLKQKLQLINVVFKFYKKYKYILLLTYSTKVMKITWIASAICSTSALAALTARFRRWSMDSRPMSIFLLSSGTAFNILAVLSVTDTKPGGRPLQSWDGSNNLKCKSIS